MNKSKISKEILRTFERASEDLKDAKDELDKASKQFDIATQGLQEAESALAQEMMKSEVRCIASGDTAILLTQSNPPTIEIVSSVHSFDLK